MCPQRTTTVDDDDETKATHTTTVQEEEEADDDFDDQKQQPSNASKKKKRKIALFFGYNGDGYQGMQRNPGAKTIEDDLEKAIVNAGGIATSNAGNFNKVHWNRAARTDKGVSAVGQVVSFKCMNADDGNTETMVRAINEHLPRNKIVAFGATRVTGGFSAKNQCDRRKYEYVVPVRTFDVRFPAKRKRRAERKNENEDGEKKIDDEGAEDTAHADATKDRDDGTEEEKRKENSSARDDDEEEEEEGEEEKNQEPYVFDEAERTKVNDILKHFVGTHNFHNYATKVDCDTPQARRFVISFSCSMPFKIQGEYFVKFEILGQSFLFNMIRKLVGMTIGVARGYCDMSDLLFALRTKQRVNTPMAPELGLFLCECQYDAYNKRFSTERVPLRLDNWRDKVEAFKQQTVYKHIYDREYVIKDNMGEWIHKFISDKDGFREQYDLAMHRALLKEEKLAPLSAKNSQKQRANNANNSQNQQGPKAPSATPGGGEANAKKDDGTSDPKKVEASTVAKEEEEQKSENKRDEEALLLRAAKSAAERVSKKRALELEKQEERKRREIARHEERVKNGMVVGKVEYNDDEMSE